MGVGDQNGAAAASCTSKPCSSIETLLPFPSMMAPSLLLICIAVLLVPRATAKGYAQVTDTVLTDGTCCIEPGRCGGVGIYIPPCERNTSFFKPPTKTYFVTAPPPPPVPPATFPQPVLTCWDGSTCAGRLETDGIQCCSAGV